MAPASPMDVMVLLFSLLGEDELDEDQTQIMVLLAAMEEEEEEKRDLKKSRKAATPRMRYVDLCAKYDDADFFWLLPIKKG